VSFLLVRLCRGENRTRDAALAKGWFNPMAGLLGRRPPAPELGIAYRGACISPRRERKDPFYILRKRREVDGSSRYQLCRITQRRQSHKCVCINIECGRGRRRLKKFHALVLPLTDIDIALRDRGAPTCFAALEPHRPNCVVQSVRDSGGKNFCLDLLLSLALPTRFAREPQSRHYGCEGTCGRTPICKASQCRRWDEFHARQPSPTKRHDQACVADRNPPECLAPVPGFVARLRFHAIPQTSRTPS